MTADPVCHRGLCDGAVTLLGWLDAAGAALVTEDGVVLLGHSPPHAEVCGIATWFAGRADQVTIFATDRLPQTYPAAEAFQTVASGLLTMRIIRGNNEFVMWFRPELIARTVSG